MSVYNGMPLLCQAVESILAQSFRDFEFVIIDDGSTDGSSDYLSDAASKDSRIRVIRQENAGLTLALIRGVAEARAPLIARMDADDLSHPNRLEKQLAFLGDKPNLVATTCGIEFVTLDLISLGVRDRLYSTETIPFFNSMFNCIGGHGQMVFRRTAYDKVGGYDPAFRYTQDYDLWARLLRLGLIGQTPGILYRQRLGHGSITIRHGKHQRDLAVDVVQREFQFLAGKRLEREEAEAVFDLWSHGQGTSLPISALFRAERNIRLLSSSYLASKLDSRDPAKNVEEHVARLWATALEKTSLRSPFRFLTLASLVSRWSPRLACRVLWRTARAKVQDTFQLRSRSQTDRASVTDFSKPRP